METDELIYLDERAGISRSSKIAFLVGFGILPLVSLAGIYLLYNALAIDIPIEIDSFGIDSRMILVIVTLSTGWILCAYVFFSFMYILVIELPHQLSKVNLVNKDLCVTTLTGKEMWLRKSDVHWCGPQQMIFYWHAPFSYSSLGWKYQYVMVTKHGERFFLVHDIAKNYKTQEQLGFEGTTRIGEDRNKM